MTAFLIIFRLYKICNINKMNVPEEFKFRQKKASFHSEECEVTNDVRYQECTEITLDLDVEKQKSQGLFLFLPPVRGGFFIVSA